MILQGDNLELLKTLDDNSVDSVVTDPPYALTSIRKRFGKEGSAQYGTDGAFQRASKGFMGKEWDAEVPTVEFWREVYRVLKPGGHVVSFGGTRTYHRMAVNIEDAGFEIRDQIMWLYGSGFPKSLNIGKAVDKLQGNERVVVGDSKRHGGGSYGMFGYEVNNKETKGQSEWEGWGTSLKPAQEIIAVAQKPEDLEGTALNLIYIIKSELWKLYVKIVESSSELNQVEQKEALDTAQCLVEKNTNIQVALQGLMDMSQLRLMENICWNTVGLWSNILEDLYQKMSRYTTSTKSNLIIDLKTLKSLEWQNILENIIQVKNKQTDGVNVNVLTAEVLFNALNLKLKDIQRHSVEDNVIYKEDKMDCLNEPICLARKPLSEKTIVENVLKYGTGGINIDGSRVGIEIISIHNAPKGTFAGGEAGRGSDTNSYRDSEGRFPANIILECICDEVIKGENNGLKKQTFDNYGNGEYGKKDGRKTQPTAKEIEGTWYKDKADIHTNPDCPCRILDEQSGISITGASKPKKKYDGGNLGGGNDIKDYPSSKGGASRFFYQAKVSKKERNMGLDHFEDKTSHPTVKPVQLMYYLVNLITPKGGVILDPFMGSGSTGIATLLGGYEFIGMEMDEEYFKIAEARIKNYQEYRQFLK